MKTIKITILGYRKPQRYAIRRTVQSAFLTLQRDYPDIALDFHEITEVPDILKITPVFVYASLMIEDKLVCVGLFPKKEEVMGWLKAAIADKPIKHDVME